MGEVTLLLIPEAVPKLVLSGTMLLKAIYPAKPMVATAVIEKSACIRFCICIPIVE